MLTGNYSWIIGLRYLRAKRSQHFISVITFLSMAGIALGVAALIVVIAVMTGFREELQRQILGVTSHVVVQPFSGNMKDWAPVLERVAETPGVTGAAPYILRQAMVTARGVASGIVVRGIEPQLEKGVSNLHDNMKQGSMADLGDFGIILGNNLANTMGVEVGDGVTLVAPTANVTVAGTLPRMKRFRVAGIFDSGMYEYDSSLAYIRLDDAQAFFQYGNRVSGIEVKTPHPDQATPVRLELDRRLAHLYWIRDWMQMNRNFFNALQMEKVTMFVILSLVVLVAAFNIVSSLIMVVMEKNKEIAILKTMGASSGGIIAIFVINGGIVGITGTLAGLGLGLLLSFNLEAAVGAIERALGIKLLNGDVYFIDHLPATVIPSDVAWITIASLLISLLATLYPAWRASRIDPVEALRYE